MQKRKYNEEAGYQVIFLFEMLSDWWLTSTKIYIQTKEESGPI